MSHAPSDRERSGPGNAEVTPPLPPAYEPPAIVTLGSIAELVALGGTTVPDAHALNPGG